jgi:hypothetical protein
MELIACNVKDITDTPVVEVPVNVLIFPNPCSSELTLESDKEIESESVSVYNMIGQEMDIAVLDVEHYRVRLNLVGQTPGIYFVRFRYEDSFVTRKFSYIPK